MERKNGAIQAALVWGAAWGVWEATAEPPSPNLILFPTTTRTREFAAMSALDLNSNVITDATAIEENSDSVVVTRPIYEGKLFEKVTCSGTPQFITIRGRAFPKPKQHVGKSGTITKLEAKTDAISTVEGYSVTAVGVSLSDAGVIVSGGRGVSNNPALTPPAGLDDKQAEIWRAQQGFALIGELAGVLGGAVGASRAAVDGGYIPYSHGNRYFLGMQWNLPAQFYLDLYGEYYDKDYEERYPSTSKQRCDIMKTVTGSLTRIFADKYSVSIGQLYTRNKSSVDVFDYDRAITSLFFTVRF